MMKHLIFIILFMLLPVSASAGLMSDKKGDKLIECQLKRASEIDKNLDDIEGGSRFAAKFPVYIEKNSFSGIGREVVDTTKIRVFDPAKIFSGMKINVYIDYTDRSGFVAGAAISAEPLMLIINPSAPKEGRFFSAVIAVDRMTLKPKDDFQWGGWCSIDSGATVLSRFEAFK
jgi:hypothetical protein